jgi:hypothetical protein
MKTVSKTTLFDTKSPKLMKRDNTMQKLLILTIVILLLTLATFAKEWNGIIPLISTRAQVIKLLGEPKPPNHEVLGEHFAIDGENVYINWTRADCRDEENIIAGTPPPALNVVVHQITVDLKSMLTLEDVKKIDPPKEISNLPGFTNRGSQTCVGSGGKWLCSETNLESGFGYNTNTENEVDRLYYFPSDKEVATWREKTKPCQGEKKY